MEELRYCYICRKHYNMDQVYREVKLYDSYNDFEFQKSFHAKSILIELYICPNCGNDYAK